MFRAIAAKKGVNVINVKAPRMLLAYGFLKSLFAVLENHRCPVDLVSTSEVSVSLVVDPSRDIAGIVPELKRLGEVEVETNKAIVCLVGRDIKGRVGIAASVFNVLANTGVNVHMISQGASEINISVVVDEADVPRAVKALHGELFTKPLNQRARKSKLPAVASRSGQREPSYKLAALSAGGDD
jgi:aspartate kinase